MVKSLDTQVLSFDGGAVIFQPNGEGLLSHNPIVEYKGTQFALVSFNELRVLLGQLLTHIDATYTDREQREAQKSLTKNIVNEWMREIYAHSVEHNSDGSLK